MQEIVVATSNVGKIREINDFFTFFSLPFCAVAFSEKIPPFDIDENGIDFKENALIKAHAVSNHISDMWILADDSGISVPVLGGEPGLYSARYAGIGATDSQNRAKLIERLQENNITQTPAYYTAALALVKGGQNYVVHGWLHGNVISEERGTGGFGYDPLFIPEGFTQTLGELPLEVKISLSHRSRALELMMSVFKTL